MSRYLYALGGFSFRRRWLVLGVWLTVLLGFALAFVGFRGEPSDNFTIPGTESQHAVEQLQRNLPAFAGAQTQLTIAAPENLAITDPAFAPAIDRAVANLGAVPDIAAAGGIAFRAALVPLTSIIGFLLSVFAALGVQVAVFQWGWGASVLGVTPGETISFLPIIVLAIIFGLSSDYEVFVVSRIKEELGGTTDAQEAVRNGVGLSARVVTAAALIMFGVFIAFLAGSDPIIKAIGLSLAVGVLLDAFVVRLTLIPAIMSILGDRMWMRSKWFDKYVPDLDIEGTALESAHQSPADVR